MFRKDIKADIPVTIVHPDALPDIPQPPPLLLSNPRYAATPASAPHLDPRAPHAWIPNLQHQPVPMSYAYDQRYYSQHIPVPYPHQGAYTPLNVSPPHRPSSAGPLVTSPHAMTSYVPLISGLPISPATPPRLQSSSRQTYTSPSVPPLPPQPSSNAHFNLSQSVQGVREQGQGEVASRISHHLRQTSVATGRGRSASPVAYRFGYPEPLSNALCANDANDIEDGLISTSCNQGGTTEPLLHSPRPQMQHKQSYTTLNGKDVAKSENVVELEKLASGLLDDTTALSRRGGKKKKMQIESTSKVLALVPSGVNKTLPVPPPLTKPRQSSNKKPDDDSANVSVPLDSLFTPLSLPVNSNAGPAIEATSPHHCPTSVFNLPSSTEANLPTPRTPTLVAYKRPPKLDRAGGGGENGLDALERRLLAEVGTKQKKDCFLEGRKQEKEKKPDVRDVLISSSSVVRDEVVGTRAVKGKNAGADTGSGTPVSSGPPRSVPSTSTTPNPEMRATGGGSASSERQDESAISSLTLDQSSIGDNDHDGKQMQEQVPVPEGEKEKDREDDDQESMDGGKTHRAGKSVVGVESYFQSRNNHRRELAAVEPSPYTQAYVNSAIVNHDVSASGNAGDIIPAKKAAPVASRKSAQTRGRVAAWLGNIDPDEPPQEEIIPPSPSVVKPLEYEWDDEYVGGHSPEKEDWKPYKRKNRSGSRPRSRSSSWSPPPIPVSGPTPTLSRQPTLLIEKKGDDVKKAAEASVEELIAASPDPRSSGFMPIEAMKAQRDSVTKSMSRSLMRHIKRSGDMTVALEARKVMDIWSEGLPGHDSSLKKQAEKDEEKKRMDTEYPLMKPVVAKTQTVRTDKKVSPPSVSTYRQDGTTCNPETRGEQSITSPPKGNKPFNGLFTPPMSYANVASGASRPTSPAVVTKGGAVVSSSRKLPVFPPLQKQDQEVKYDVKSARGGRGGQVTHVAALWATGAAGSSNTGSGTGARSGTANAAAVKFGGKREVKVGASGSNAVINRSQPSAPSNVNASTKKSGTPLIPPRGTMATSPSPNASSTSTTQLNSHQVKTRPLPRSLYGSNSASPLSGSKKPNRYLQRSQYNKTLNAAIPVQMKKSTSVPASISSSFATPVLSSTASLARPVGGARNNSGKAAGTVVGSPGMGQGTAPGEERKHKSGLDVVEEGKGGPNIMKKSGVARAGGGGAVKHDNSGEIVGQPRPPREMVFGQARLRDLIKRYQS